MVCTDTRKITPESIFFALKGENFNGNTFADEALKLGARYVVIDEEAYQTSNHTILVPDVLQTLQELAAYHRTYLNLPIIALTGSNGKTTTKELINATLSQKYKTIATVGNLNNHIGVPLTLLSMTKDTEIGIVEMGANHLKEIAFLSNIVQPNYGYITNFGKAHLEGFGGIEGVIKGKSELYDHLIAHNCTAFVNGNDVIQMEKTADANQFVFGDDTNANISIIFIDAQPFVKCSYNNLIIQSCLIGDYNFNNIAAAIAIGHYFKVEDTAIKQAIEQYNPTNNRSQIIEKAGHKTILDAYNANPTSMTAALLNFEKQSGSKIAFIGDMFELGDEAAKEHQNIVDLATSLAIDQLVFIGNNFYSTYTQEDSAYKFESFEAFKTGFNMSDINQHATLLIKGSRGMALERILDLI